MEQLDYIFTEHARMEMARRGISESEIKSVLENPEQCFKIREGRMVYQSKQTRGNLSKEYIIRVFVDVDRKPIEVVTVYLSSKINKYWRK